MRLIFLIVTPSLEIGVTAMNICMLGFPCRICPATEGVCPVVLLPRPVFNRKMESAQKLVPPPKATERPQKLYTGLLCTISLWSCGLFAPERLGILSSSEQATTHRFPFSGGSRHTAPFPICQPRCQHIGPRAYGRKRQRGGTRHPPAAAREPRPLHNATHHSRYATVVPVLPDTHL